MSGAINDGGAAFPVPCNQYGVRPRNLLYGMTLRQWYAGKALVGIIRDREPMYVDDRAKEYTDNARLAFSMADAMIAYEEKERGQ